MSQDAHPLASEAVRRISPSRLEGDGEAPPLTGGEPFWAWSGKPMTALFDKIHKEMPHHRPGTLGLEASANLLANVLQFNKFPVG
jgi:hypothetical protein